MKKHVRFCLFAALLVALLGVTVLCAAAAGNYQVLNDADAEVGTYATLAEAKAVVRDNYTIKLLDDTTETANTALNVNYTYTVDGDGHTITNTGDVAFLTVSRGDVTFKDVTLDHKTTATDKHIFLISGSPTLTLNGVTLLGGYRDFNLTSSGTPHVTVTGASDLGRGVGDRIAHLGNASRSGCLTIENGTFTCGPNYGIVGSGAKIVVRGGTFTTDDKPFFAQIDNMYVSPIVVEGGTFNVTGSGNAFQFTYTSTSNTCGVPYNGHGTGNVVLNISGGTFNVSGSGNVIKTQITTIFYKAADSGLTGNAQPAVVISGGTFAGADSAARYLIDADNVSVRITGGSFTNGRILGYNENIEPLLITGGSFDTDISRYVPGRGASGITESAGVYTVNSLNLPVFCGTQLALGKSLTLYIYTIVPTAAVPANEAKRMSVRVNMAGRYTVLTDPEVLSAYPDGTPADAGYTLLRFTFSGIAPQYMNDALTAVLRRANDATYATTSSSYSIRQYCQALLSDGSVPADTKTLVSDLLCYGAAAQNYLDYRTDALVTTGVTGMTASEFTTISGAPAAAFSGSGSNGYKLTECGLHFDSLNRLFVRFTAPDPDAIKITYSVAGEDRGRAVIRTDGLGYIAYTEGLVTTDFDKAVIFTMTDNKDDGVNVATQSCSYSVKTFMQNNQNNDGEPTVKALARTLAGYQASAASFLAADFTPVLRFVAISDIHFLTNDDSSSNTTVMPTQAHDLSRCVNRLTTLFTGSYAYAGTQAYDTVDAFMLVGDNTDDGTEKQIEDFLAIVKDNINSSESKLLIVNGNHEFYDTAESGSGGNAHTTTDSRLTTKLAASGISNYSGLKFHTTVNGYHFIGFSPTNSGGRSFSDEIADWLDGEIAAAVAANTAAGRPNDPVFVCQHQQVCATVYGCPGTGSTYAQANIRSVLAKYPQVVDFAGHSHSYIEHPRSIWQGEFTALSTGTLAYSSTPTNTRGGSHATGHSDPYNEHNEKDTAEFTIVELDENNRMRLRYFYIALADDTTVIPIGERIVNVGDSSKFNWTGEQNAAWTAPRFTEGQALTRNAVETPTSLNINIPQADCSALIYNYRCELWQGGSLIKTISRLSGQYTHPFNDCVVPFTGLTPNTEYTVKVYPISSTGAFGLPLTATFTTAAQDSVYTPDVFSAQFNDNGTVTNAVNGDVLVKGGTATAEAGKATFTGSGDFEWRGIEPYYELIQTTFTLEAYAKVTDASRGKFIVGNFEYHIPSENPSRTQIHGGFGFKVESDGKISFYLLTSNTGVSWHNIADATLLQHAVTTTTAYDNDTYVHLVGTYDGSNIKFYVNGELVGTISRSGVMDYPLKTTTQYLSIGGDSGIDYNSRDFMTGEISKVNIYSTAMNADQVTTLYNNR